MPEAKRRRTIVVPVPGRGPHLHAVAGVNEHGTLSITTQRGCRHEDLLLHAPTDCRKDLEALVAMHLRSVPDGMPMHAVANLVFALREERFDEAAAGLHGAAGAEDMKALTGKILDRLAKEPLAIGRDPDGKYPANAITKAQDAVWEAEARVFVEERCLPLWREQAAKALAALSRPDYHPDYDPDDAPRRDTFTGFLAVNGITMRVEAPLAERATGHAQGPEGRHPTMVHCELTRDGRTARAGYFTDPRRGSRPPRPFERPQRLPAPKRDEALATLQAQFAAVERGDADYGLATSRLTGEGIERGREALVRGRDDFRRIVGEDLYREFMESVGPNPPFPDGLDGAPGGPRP